MKIGDKVKIICDIKHFKNKIGKIISKNPLVENGWQIQFNFLNNIVWCFEPKDFVLMNNDWQSEEI